MSALGGLPGPYVKWCAKAFGAEGLYRMLTGFSDKSVTALSTVAAGIPSTMECPQPRVFLFQVRSKRVPRAHGQQMGHASL